MSTLRANSIEHTDGGPIAMVKQDPAKSWLRSSASATISDSFNTSSSSDQGTGNYDYTFTNNMTNTVYSITCNGSYAEIAEPENTTASTSKYTIRIFGRQDSLNTQDQVHSSQICGELA